MGKCLTDNELYMKDIAERSERFPWEMLQGRRLLIAGATGLIGRYLIDLLMYMNTGRGLSCRITALSRNEASAHDLISHDYFESDQFNYIAHDICSPLPENIGDEYDYVLHLAGNTHPIAYSTRPVETILTNVYGTRNLLEYCSTHAGCRFVLASSVEIYGENRGDVELFDESYLGYIDSNTLRAGYPESKRLCETLCQAYISERSGDAIILRLPRVIGPTMGENDSKAAAQFIRKAVAGEDIVLKSKGDQYYSFLYAGDAVTGILTAMLKGESGMAYNIAHGSCDATLRSIAEICADEGKVNVIYEIPDETERRGYSTATKARLEGSRIASLGWRPHYDIKKGIEHTIRILRHVAGR